MSNAVVTLLAELGRNPDEIVLSLRRQGILARRGSTCFYNPIIRFINRNVEVGGRMHITIGSDLLTIVRDGSGQSVRLPQPVCAFLDRFHAGAFPQIEQP